MPMISAMSPLKIGTQPDPLSSTLDLIFSIHAIKRSCNGPFGPIICEYRFLKLDIINIACNGLSSSANRSSSSSLRIVSASDAGFFPKSDDHNPMIYPPYVYAPNETVEKPKQNTPFYSWVHFFQIFVLLALLLFGFKSGLAGKAGFRT